MAAWLGKDVAKLKGKGGKWKYLSEAEMLEHSAPFAPYRYVIRMMLAWVVHFECEWKLTIDVGVCSCGTCGNIRTRLSTR